MSQLEAIAMSRMFVMTGLSGLVLHPFPEATSIFGLTMTIIPPLWQHTSTCSDGENDAFTMAAATGPYEGYLPVKPENHEKKSF